MATLRKTMSAWAKAHPTRDGGTWRNYCGSAMFRFNDHTIGYTYARDAIRASRIESTDYRKAPIGAYHLWRWGTADHVGQDATGGGRAVFMASGFLTYSIVPYLGYASVPGWAQNVHDKTGVWPTYLGWTRNYGANRNTRKADDLWERNPEDEPRPPKPPAQPTATPASLPTKPKPKPETDRQKVRRIAKYLNRNLSGGNTVASVTGQRTKGYWKLLQRKGRHDHIYNSPYRVNGIPGPKTRHLEDVYDKRAK